MQCVGVIERYANRMGDGDDCRRIEVVEVAIDGQMVVAKGLISVGDVEGGVRRVGGPGDDVRTGAGIIRVMQGAKVVTPMPAASASSRNRSACRLSAPSTSDFALTMIWRLQYR